MTVAAAIGLILPMVLFAGSVWLDDESYPDPPCVCREWKFLRLGRLTCFAGLIGALIAVLSLASAGDDGLAKWLAAILVFTSGLLVGSGVSVYALSGYLAAATLAATESEGEDISEDCPHTRQETPLPERNIQP